MKPGLDMGVRMDAEGIDAHRVGVDSVGVGAATVGRLSEMGLRVQALNGGMRAVSRGNREARARVGKSVAQAEVYSNFRSQIHWQLREDLRRAYIALPKDSELFEDLTTPTWDTKNGKIVVESKEDIRKRLGRSPDKGDAVAYWNWVRPRPEYDYPEREEEAPIRNYDHAFDAMHGRFVEQRQLGTQGCKRW